MNHNRGVIILLLAITAILAYQTWYPRPVTAPVTWEYQLVPIEAYGVGKFGEATIPVSRVSVLDAMGVEGWEMVTSILEIETEFPNFGSGQYVNGIKPNVRSNRALFIFKRPLTTHSYESTGLLPNE